MNANQQRILHGGAAVRAGTPDFGSDEIKSDAVDAITNILHFCDSEAINDIEGILRSAAQHFENEDDAKDEFSTLDLETRCQVADILNDPSFGTAIEVLQKVAEKLKIKSRYEEEGHDGTGEPDPRDETHTMTAAGNKASEITITKAQLRALWSEFLVGEFRSESELIVIHELGEDHDHDRGELDLHEGDVYASTRGGDKAIVARLDGARIRLPLAEGRGE